jgi:hypothetical protein
VTKLYSQLSAGGALVVQIRRFCIPIILVFAPAPDALDPAVKYMAVSSPAERASHNVIFRCRENKKKIPFFENTFHMPKNNLQAVENQRIN